MDEEEKRMNRLRAQLHSVPRTELSAMIKDTRELIRLSLNAGFDTAASRLGATLGAMTAETEHREAGGAIRNDYIPNRES